MTFSAFICNMRAQLFRTSRGNPLNCTRLKHQLVRTIRFLILVCLSFQGSRLAAQSCSGRYVGGVRASRILENYPGGVFPNTAYWVGAAEAVNKRFSNSCPGAVWIVSLYQGSGVTEVQFPSSVSYPHITFSAGDSSEAYLDAFDRSGDRIWLQVEPGSADVDTLIDLVLSRYGTHPCVAGFGIDVEWYKTASFANGKPVTDAEAARWEARVKLHNPAYTLFLKHWLTNRMPPMYRGEILFTDDSQNFSSLAEMVAEFGTWATTFSGSKVAFQYGYASDSAWWGTYPDPVKTIGDSLIQLIPNLQGLFWVDFTIAKIYPVTQAYFVSTAGDDANPGTETLPWRTIQKAFNVADQGSTVFVKEGVYNEKPVLNVSGSALAPITFQNYLHDTVIIDGTGKAGDQIVLLQNKRWIRIVGFEIRNNFNQSFGTGIWIRGYGDHIELRNNRIHDMRAATGGGDAMGISVYGSDAAASISHLIIDGNQVFDCQPGHSESLTLNGNVDTFQVTNNLVHDNDNIGIDMIGGEGTCPAASFDAARNGVCSGNTVYNCRSNYGGGYAAGIYVDGGRNIVVERNSVHQCDIGLEIGCENHGKTASGMTVRENLIFDNDKGGLGFGGYDYPATGQVTNSSFHHNTCLHNDVLATGQGELYINYALSCVVKNNIFSSTAQNRLLTTTIGNVSGNILNYNLWWTPGGINDASVDYNGTIYAKFSDYISATGQDQHSLFADPRFISTSLPGADLHLQPGSPAIDAGDPMFVAAGGEVDPDGNPRLAGTRVDIGAYETTAPQPPSAPPPPVLVGMTGNPATPILVWRRAAGATSYHLQVSSARDFTTAIVDDSTLADSSRQIDSLSGGAVFYWHVRAGNGGGRSAWSQLWSFSSASGDISTTVSDRWNMVSVPLDVVNPSAGTLYPTAASPAFAYEGTYARRDTLSRGAGYWMKFTGNQIVSLRGSTILSDTLELNEGWNMIGSITSPIAPASIASLEPNVVASNFFGYDGGYGVTDSIRPGKGYWVKLNQNARLLLSAAATPIGMNHIRMVATSDEPPASPDAPFAGNRKEPDEYSLDQNYPNPWNPSTTISYSVPTVSYVRLEVYNTLGQLVATLADGVEDAGTKKVRWAAGVLASGVYFCRIAATSVDHPGKTFTQVRKMLLVR